MFRIRHQVLLLIRVMWDFVQGMFGFDLDGPCVTVFGSARLPAHSVEYAIARKVGMALGENGFSVMTGGGPGLMEGASRGAIESGGKTIACRIRLSKEQSCNSYIHRSVSFRYFFVRKVMLLRYSCAIVVLPGGLGTLDELFEVFTLIQTMKIDPLPIVFIGRDYWQPLLDLLEWMVVRGTIRAEEMDLVLRRALVTDDVREMTAHFNNTGYAADQPRWRPPHRVVAPSRESESATVPQS